jgi:hypothetical protein
MRKTILLVAVCLFTSLLLLPSHALAGSTSLTVIAPATVSQGSTFSADVKISDVTDLYDFQFDLSFNNAVLQATNNILEGTFLSGGGSTFFIPGTIDNTTGNVTFNADTLLGAVPGVSGSGTLAVFGFMALAPGTSNLTISNVLLQDSSGASLSGTTTGGSVTVQGPATVPEPSGLTLLAMGLLVLAGLTTKKVIH